MSRARANKGAPHGAALCARGGFRIVKNRRVTLTRGSDRRQQIGDIPICKQQLHFPHRTSRPSRRNAISWGQNLLCDATEKECIAARSDSL
jgi:hypothetical protein